MSTKHKQHKAELERLLTRKTQIAADIGEWKKWREKAVKTEEGALQMAAAGFGDGTVLYDFSVKRADGKLEQLGFHLRATESAIAAAKDEIVVDELEVKIESAYAEVSSAREKAAQSLSTIDTLAYEAKKREVTKLETELKAKRPGGSSLDIASSVREFRNGILGV